MDKNRTSENLFQEENILYTFDDIQEATRMIPGMKKLSYTED